MAKRTRQGIDSPPLSDMSAPKYRRVAPKQELELNMQNPTPLNQQTQEFGLRANLNTQQAPYHAPNYRPT